MWRVQFGAFLRAQCETTMSCPSIVVGQRERFMNPHASTLLILNGGSSSIRFCIVPNAPGLKPLLSGKVDRIGQSSPILQFAEHDQPPQWLAFPAAHNPSRAAGALLEWLDAKGAMESLVAVGHRVVHGMTYSQPQVVSPALIAALSQWQAVDPEHLPAEIALIQLVQERLPSVMQVACFDTAFHHAMPRVAQMMALPRRLEVHGIRRFGVHGLAYALLLEELERLAGPAAAHGRVVLAHLGNGASMAALRDGTCIDTTMGFSPASGLPMGTRSGDRDPGVAAYLYRSGAVSPEQFDRMVHHESGLLGVSEISSDMRDLLAREASAVRAAEAIALFCYEARKCIGAYAASLGGLDTLVFAGGVGENAAAVRARICVGLEFLGVELDAQGNAANAGILSRPGSG